MAARSHPKNVLGGAEERKINRVFVDSVTVVIIILFYFILFYFYFYFGEIHILTSNKMEVGIIIENNFLFLEKKWAQFATFMRKNNSEFAIYRQ
jgi:hypothetical protein